LVASDTSLPHASLVAVFQQLLRKWNFCSGVISLVIDVILLLIDLILFQEFHEKLLVDLHIFKFIYKLRNMVEITWHMDGEHRVELFIFRFVFITSVDFN
jgi:hypothetical protein